MNKNQIIDSIQLTAVASILICILQIGVTFIYPKVEVSVPIQACLLGLALRIFLTVKKLKVE